MSNLLIEWKHFDKEGKTCVRCSGTGANLVNAIEEIKTSLAERGIEIKLKETKLSENQMSESNEILIGGTPLEKLIPDAKVGENSCASCTDLVGKSSDCQCRTISNQGEVHEEIPVELIKQAIFNKLKLTNNSKNNMKIQVLGAGCPSCKKLFEITSKAVNELGLPVEVEYITDVQKIIQMGIMQSPVLAVNDKPVLVGFTSDIEKIKQAITSNNKSTSNESKPACSCGGKC